MRRKCTECNKLGTYHFYNDGSYLVIHKERREVYCMVVTESCFVKANSQKTHDQESAHEAELPMDAAREIR